MNHLWAYGKEEKARPVREDTTRLVPIRQFFRPWMTLISVSFDRGHVEILFHLSHSMCTGPLLGCLNGCRLIIFPALGNVVGKGVIGVGSTE